MKHIKIGLIPVIFLLAYTCNGPGSLFMPPSPYQDYVRSLRNLNLDHTELGKKWIVAGERIFTDSLSTRLPYQETLYFQPDRPDAFSFRFTGNEGGILQIGFLEDTSSTHKIFVDLFTRKNQRWHHIISTQDTSLLRLKIRKTKEFLLRIQPELLTAGSLDVSIMEKATLSFPVKGKNKKNIWSFFGDPRDGGTRQHYGVDIFAVKGTPVLSASPGIVTRVRHTKIGGKVVWILDTRDNQSLYYAHLSKQLVKAGQKVHRGETIGLVGHTGNARTTPPHLHFGIYRHGPHDPYPYLVGTAHIQRTFYGRKYKWGKTRYALNNVRNAPDMQGKVIHQLARSVPLKIIGDSGKWYRVRLPDNSIGYIHHSVTNAVTKSSKTESFRKAHFIYNRPDGVPLEKVTSVQVMGEYNGFWFVKSGGMLGWMRKI